MAEVEYYDGTKLLSMTDINGNKPEIYICVGNRTGGKTVYFNRLCVNRFRKTGAKFGLLYRYNYELDDVADKFFKVLKQLFFPGSEMESERRANGKYHELFLDGEPCGYAMALNDSNQIKKYSHLFSDIDSLVFDEFQSEDNKYLSDEIKRLLSVHTSIARGNGKQVRYVPLYMISNCVSIINPYFTELGIAPRLKEGCNFLRGEGFVLEQAFIETASRAQQESAFNRAFSRNNYVEFAAQNVYLNDSVAFVDKPGGKSRYICTIRYNGKDYAIREYQQSGVLYCDDSADESFSTRIAVTTDDHNVNYVVLKRNEVMISTLRYFFNRGCFRFKDLACKEALMRLVSY